MSFSRVLLLLCLVPSVATAADRPNFLWISCEDISPDLGCYGDRYAVTPNLDRLASQGVRFTRVFTHAGVCAPSRSGIITGMYPTSIGTHHMRCQGVPPAEVKCFPELLRTAGYYCTNNVKTDYQFDPPITAWDANSNKAHWRNRAEGQPFFAVFNLTTTHESQIRNPSGETQRLVAELPADQRHDPAKAKLPPYYPDTPLVRRDWANYADNITAMDRQVARILEQLEEDGLADDTIVWFWGDHGRGLPRGKRWLYDSGTHIPLIIRVPEKFRALVWNTAEASAPRAGSRSDELIAAVDFGPSVLSIAGVEIPAWMQGAAFLGPKCAEPRTYVYGARDRMDDRYDLIRAVRDTRFKYIRNFMPQYSQAQDIWYMNLMPTMQELRRLHASGELNETQERFFAAPKPLEELYDTATDPHEIKNLASDPRHHETLERMRQELKDWMRRTGDLGLITEPEFNELQHPGGNWQTTSQPVIDRGNESLLLTSATPGASIACRIDASSPKDPWKLYTEAVRLTKGQRLEAIACRIGFHDSPVATYIEGEALEKASPASESARSHWQEVLQESGLRERLLDLADLDFKGTDAIPDFVSTLQDESAPVRHWAVLRLHFLCKEDDRAKVAPRLSEMMDSDPSPAVRVAAAHALADWNSSPQAIAALEELVANDRDFIRVHAAQALDDLDEKARPAIPSLKRAMSDPFNYVVRVSYNALTELGEDVPEPRD